MGHESETQTHSDAVPNTIRRGAIYYYKRRIPVPLVRAAAFGLKKSGKPVEFRQLSLKTSDPRVARRLAALQDAESETLFAAKEQELAEAQGAKFANGEGGRPQGTTMESPAFLAKHRDICRKLREGQSVRNTAKITGKGVSTVQRVKAALLAAA